MQKHLLIPSTGRRVRLPETGEVMPAEGMEVTINAYWQRRIEDGDVQLASKPAQKKPTAGKE